MKSSKPRIVLELTGGEVAGIYASDTNVIFTVVDWDEIKLGERAPSHRVLPLTVIPAEVQDALNAAD